MLPEPLDSENGAFRPFSVSDVKIGVRGTPKQLKRCYCGAEFGDSVRADSDAISLSCGRVLNICLMCLRFKSEDIVTHTYYEMTVEDWEFVAKHKLRKTGEDALERMHLERGHFG